MAIEFYCPSCQTLIRTPDEAAGKKARCPSCQNICPVPTSTTSPSPPQSASPAANLGTGNSWNAPDQPPAKDPFTPMTASPFASKPTNPFSNLPGSAPETANPFAGPAMPPIDSPPANPFSDAASTGQGGLGSESMNPYASPAYAVSTFGPLTREQVRSKLLGPAVGISVSALFCLAYATLTIVAAALDPDRPVPQGEAERFGYYVGFYGVMIVMILPSLGMLLGAYAMFTGKGLGLAWTGAVSAVMPCNPCCIIGIGFGIWAMVLLAEPRVANALK